jgi:hypothetical protein
MQGTLPSSSKCPSKKLMWRGVTLSYIIIAICLFPIAIAGFWTYGNKVKAQLYVLCSTVNLLHPINLKTVA